jgi:hypothetical protein
MDEEGTEVINLTITLVVNNLNQIIFLNCSKAKTLNLIRAYPCIFGTCHAVVSVTLRPHGLWKLSQLLTYYNLLIHIPLGMSLRENCIFLGIQWLGDS